MICGLIKIPTLPGCPPQLGRVGLIPTPDFRINSGRVPPNQFPPPESQQKSSHYKTIIPHFCYSIPASKFFPHADHDMIIWNYFTSRGTKSLPDHLREYLYRGFEWLKDASGSE